MARCHCGRSFRGLCCAGRPHGQSDVPRLHQARRHGDLSRHARPLDTPRLRRCRACTVDLRGHALDEPCARLPPRLIPPPRGRPDARPASMRPGSGSRISTFLAVLLGLGLYQLVAGARSIARPSCADCRSRRAGCSDLRLRALGRHQGALDRHDRRAHRRPRPNRRTEGRARPPDHSPWRSRQRRLVGVLSVGGAVWLAPLLAGAIVLTVRGAGAGKHTASRRLRSSRLRASSPFRRSSRLPTWLSHTGDFTSDAGYGNLTARLNPLQIFGIWPSGDFRTPPSSLDVTYVFVGRRRRSLLALLLSRGWRRQAWEIPLGVGTAGFASASSMSAKHHPGSAGRRLLPRPRSCSRPRSPVQQLSSRAAKNRRSGRGLRDHCGGSVVERPPVPGGLRGAPSSRLAELESIGHDFSGQGPTLLTEFESYGARHFLRTMDAEAASELRRRAVNLRAGGVADTGVSPDVDEIQLDDLLEYLDLLVLRRSGVGSRPPSVYALRSSGDNYQVWQRSTSANRILEHVPAGSRLQPAAELPCVEILRLGRLAAASNGLLATVLRPPAVVIEGDGTVAVPTAFERYGEVCGRALSLRGNVAPRTVHRPEPRGSTTSGSGAPSVLVSMSSSTGRSSETPGTCFSGRRTSSSSVMRRSVVVHTVRAPLCRP